MMQKFLLFSLTLFLTALSACEPGWQHTGGLIVLPEVAGPEVQPVGLPQTGNDRRNPPASKAVSLVLPDGWHWVSMGDNLLATRDGVFLHNIIVERIRAGEAKRNSSRKYPLAARSFEDWPVQIPNPPETPFRSGMSPAEAAEAVLKNRRNDPRVIALNVQSVDMQTVAQTPGFKAVYGFQLKVQERWTAYRAVCYGFMLDGSFYGITYTAARRYYYDRDIGNFESVMQSFRVLK